MKGTVNPFEPWRPVEARIPPPLHAGRPWRPPPPPPARAAVEELPSVEPVHPSSWNKPPERPKRPQGQGGQPSARRTPVSQLTAFVVLGVLVFLCLDSVGWCLGTHMPRLMVLGASAGLFAGMAFHHPRRSWQTRLRGMASALALAGIALWFVPTIHGVSLWSAYRQVEKLRILPAGDVAAYQRGAAARRTVVEDFPSFAPDVSAAEQAWVRRTVNEAIENADRQSKNDPHAALAHLQQLEKDLSRLEHYASVRKELESARRRTLEACAKAVRREAGELLGKKP
ncbi:MAG TPA: hypothetical protein VMG10_10980 [Gemmataceae bacterium]|nr:hypothetical protein [Gemmataceae bacterium]